MKKSPDMRRVILHLERLGNHLGHARAGPQIGGIPSLAWSVQENLNQSLLLALVETGLAAGMWFGS
jgi:hypothetical protein